MTTPEDTRAAWYLIDLWRDGISYHVDPVDILRLHVIATAVIGRARTEGAASVGDVAEAARRLALLDAADWLDQDIDEEGPSYHIDGLAWYDGPAWASAHLRKRAESGE